MNNPILVGLVSWLLPGAGYLMQGKYVRAAVIAGVVWVMFGIALASGGAHYPGFDLKDGMLLYLLNIFARFGNGFGAVVSLFLAAIPSPDVAALSTFEYGGRFLEIAGLINYLAVMDSVDIAVGRKA